MRFQRLQARHFGPLREVDLSFDREVVLLYGPNEAGKSSFRAALETILYGFSPATREAHPIARFGDERLGGDVAEGDARLELHLEAQLAPDTGPPLQVVRKLGSTGRSAVGEVGRPPPALRRDNRPLPAVHELPRRLYQSVYSLELEQLAALDPSVQEQVDSLLLPVAGAVGLRPIHRVRAELGPSHRELWRNDNRGKPRARQIADDLAAARRRLDVAAESERGLRAAREERGRVAERLDTLRARKQALDSERKDAPYLEQLREVALRRRRLGGSVDLAPLGDLPLADPASLRAEIRELEETVRSPRERLARPVAELDPDLQAVLDLGVAEALVPIEEHARERHSAEALYEDAEVLRGNAERELAALCLPVESEVSEISESAETSKAPPLDAAMAVDLGALRDAQRTWAEAWEEFAQAIPEVPPPRRWPLVFPLLAGAAAAGAALGWLPQRPALGVAAGAVAVGLVLLLFGRRSPDREEPPSLPAPHADDLAGLALPPTHLASPSGLQRVVESLARVQANVEDADGLEEQGVAALAEIQRREQRWQELARLLEPGGALGATREGGHEEDSLVRALFERAERAQSAAELALEDRAERSRAKEAVAAVEPVLERKRDHLERVLSVLRSAQPGGGDLEAAYTRVSERLDDARFVQRREAELRADPRWAELSTDPRLEEPAAPSASDSASMALDSEIETASARLGALDEALGRTDDAGLARARDEIAALEDELARVERERDRLALLDGLLEAADARFREAHQPDVLARASAFLERATRGRYDEISYGSGSGVADADGFYVRGPAAREPVPVGAPLSSGTLDQIFLSLRLGLLDHLDAERETFPLVLDDALLRMDDARRLAVYELLGEVSRRRQVFLLTCHGSIASEIEDALDIARIEL